MSCAAVLLVRLPPPLPVLHPGKRGGYKIRARVPSIRLDPDGLFSVLFHRDERDAEWNALFNFLTSSWLRMHSQS